MFPQRRRGKEAKRAQGHRDAPPLLRIKRERERELSAERREIDLLPVAARPALSGEMSSRAESCARERGEQKYRLPKRGDHLVDVARSERRIVRQVPAVISNALSLLKNPLILSLAK